jgi:DNA-binding NtrC family response regulator
MLIRALLAVESTALRERIERLMSHTGVVVDSVPSGDHLLERLAKESCDLVVLSRSAVAEPAGRMLPAIHALADRPEVIVLIDREDPEDRATLQAAGSFAVVYSGLSDGALKNTLTKLVQRRHETAVDRLAAEERQPTFRLAEFVSASPAMHRLVDLARRVAASGSSLLIVGETGVGKEWLARAVHAEGSRSASPFIAINCGAVTESLLESELFGHEKGAFTGAIRSRRGYFELAHRGTLFLDEIAEMPAHLQTRLLRALQDRTIQRVGGETTIEVDVRIIAATNRDLEEAMAEKTFRRDLYYRLAVVTLQIPPLRERREDVPELCARYLARFRRQLGRRVSHFEPSAMAALTAYDWPGNVRELINVVERAVLLATGESVTRDDLPAGIVAAGSPGVLAGSGTGWSSPNLMASLLDRPLAEAKEQLLTALEREYLVGLLGRTGGSVGETARRAGLDPRTVYGKMRVFGLKKEDFRPAR